MFFRWFLSFLPRGGALPGVFFSSSPPAGHSDAGGRLGRCGFRLCSRQEAFFSGRVSSPGRALLGLQQRGRSGHSGVVGAGVVFMAMTTYRGWWRRVRGFPQQTYPPPRPSLPKVGGWGSAKIVCETVDAGVILPRGGPCCGRCRPRSGRRVPRRGRSGRPSWFWRSR